MIVTKKQLSSIIQEELQIVLIERDLKRIYESAELPEAIKVLQEAYGLTNKQAQLLKEGLWKKIKEWASAAKRGIKFLMEKVINFFDSFFLSYGIANTAKGAIGLILTQTEGGQAWMQKVIDSAAGSEIFQGAVPKFQGLVDWLIQPEMAEFFGVALVVGLASLLIKFVWKKGWKALGFEVKADSTVGHAGGLAAGGAGTVIRGALGV